MAGRIKVDHDGFRKRVAWRGPTGVLYELISNALDENVTFCDVRVEHVEGQRYSIRVEDDSPDGFRNLDEAYTLYADSYKANIPDKSGRFNVGEKVAIVMCDECRIESTTGTRIFEKDADVKKSPKRRERGTVFEGTLRMTREAYDKAMDEVRRIIPRPGIKLVLNGVEVVPPKIVATVTATLPTVTTNEAGELVKTVRQTEVHVYEPRHGEKGAVYELGFPVVGVEHVFLMDVRQKVPLSVDRNNVTPGFYRKLCAAVLDGTADKLTEEQARSKGVTNGIADAKSDKAVERVMELQNGDKRFIPDPNNREGNGTLFADGWNPVHGGSYDGGTWDRIKRAGAIQSVNVYAPKPDSVEFVPFPGEVTRGMRQVGDLTKLIVKLTLGLPCRVVFSGNTGLGMCAAQGGPDGSRGVRVTFHAKVLGERWFSERPMLDWQNLETICHEVGHYAGDQDCTRAHTTKALTVLAKVTTLVQTKPELFKDFR